MGKELYLNRYSTIIKRLEKSPASYAQIEYTIFNAPDIDDTPTLTYSIRTLQRDIKDIERLFNIEIKNERKGDKRYFIATKPEDEGNEHSQILLESYQIINAINKYPDFEKYVFVESRQPKGIQHFYHLLHAIQNRKIILFAHFKYNKSETTQRRVFPMALKESEKRWYLIAIDSKDEKLKTFGLDRIDNIEILKNTYKKNTKLNLPALFKNAYGIIAPQDKEPEIIKIKCTKLQADYIKSFPLHHSQTIVEEANGFVIFQLQYTLPTILYRSY